MKLNLSTARVLNIFLSGRDLNVVVGAYFNHQIKEVRETVLRFWFNTSKSIYTLGMVSQFTGNSKDFTATFLQPPNLVLSRSANEQRYIHKILPSTFTTWQKISPVLSQNWKKVEGAIEERISQAQNCKIPNCDECKAVVPLDFKFFLQILKALADGPTNNLEWRYYLN